MYGVFSNFNPMRTAGNWSAGGGVQTDKTSESVTEFDKELKALAGATPISDDELSVAKARRVRGYAQQFESLGRITNEISNLWALNLPMTELQREYDATGTITLDQVLAAAKKYRASCVVVNSPRGRSRQDRAGPQSPESGGDRGPRRRRQDSRRRNEVGPRFCGGGAF